VSPASGGRESAVSAPAKIANAFALESPASGGRESAVSAPAKIANAFALESPASGGRESAVSAPAKIANALPSSGKQGANAPRSLAERPRHSRRERGVFVRSLK